MTTDLPDLDALLALAAAATPGAWVAVYNSDDDVRPSLRQPYWFVGFVEPLDKNYADSTCLLEPDAVYIVAACNAVPALVARIRSLEKTNALLLDKVADLTSSAFNRAMGGKS